MCFYKGCFFLFDKESFFSFYTTFSFTFRLAAVVLVDEIEHIYICGQSRVLEKNINIWRQKKTVDVFKKKTERVILSQVNLFLILLDVLKYFTAKWFLNTNENWTSPTKVKYKYLFLSFRNVLLCLQQENVCVVYTFVIKIYSFIYCNLVE